jgi:predicted NodU family carbamoyl transferase
VALSCTANSKVAAFCGDNGVRLVLPPSASDTGVALGAAIAASPDPAAVTQCVNVALGRAYSPELIGEHLRTEGLSARPCTHGELAEALISKDVTCDVA